MRPGRCAHSTTSRDCASGCSNPISWPICSGSWAPNRFSSPNIQAKTGFSTELIDAAENNWPSYITSGHYTVARYYTLTEHTMTPDVLVMSRKAWSSLSAEDQEIFRNAARESSTFMRGLWRESEERARAQAPDLGVNVIEIDQRPLAAALTGLYEKVLRDVRLRLLVDSIRRAE